MQLLVLLILAAAPKPSAMVAALERLPAAKGLSVAPAPGKDIIIDDKNGYLSITQHDPSSKITSETVLALFSTRTADKVWGLRSLQMEQSTATVRVTFYLQHGQTFTDVTAEVLPVTVEDVLPPGHPPLPACQHYDVELPRHGTTLTVKAPIEAGCFLLGLGPSGFDDWYQELGRAQKRFGWDPKEVVFVEK